MEIWRTVRVSVGYEVSDLGRVRNSRTLRVLALSPNEYGYLYVSLPRSDEHSGRVRVHSIVADAFIGPRPDRHEVNHIDGDKTNNAVANLEYVTSGENKRHAYTTGLRSATRHAGETNGHASLSVAAIQQIRAMRGVVPGVALAKRYGINKSTVSKIQNGRRWAHI